MRIWLRLWNIISVLINIACIDITGNSPGNKSVHRGVKEPAPAQGEGSSQNMFQVAISMIVMVPKRTIIAIVTIVSAMGSIPLIPELPLMILGDTLVIIVWLTATMWF